MTAAKQPNQAGAARPGARARNNGTRGGRPDGQPTASQPRRAQQRPPQPGKGQAGKGQAGKGQAGKGQGGKPQPGAAPAAGTAGPDRPGPPLPFQIISLVLSLAALGDAIYLTIAHFSTVKLACSDTGHINCQAVTTSPESLLFGSRLLPVAVLGLAFYVFMTAISTPWAWRSRLRAIRWARLIGIITGMVFVLYLVYTEEVTLGGTFCLYCSYVHIITFLLFGMIVYDASARPGLMRPVSRPPAGGPAGRAR